MIIDFWITSLEDDTDRISGALVKQGYQVSLMGTNGRVSIDENLVACMIPLRVNAVNKNVALRTFFIEVQTLLTNLDIKYYSMVAFHSDPGTHVWSLGNIQYGTESDSS